MKTLISALKHLTEYPALIEALSQGQSIAVTGIGQINRSHILASLSKIIDSPLVILCQDDMAAKRLQQELEAFTSQVYPILPSRELTLYDNAVVSRAWEQTRLRQFYDLLNGKTKIQIMSWDALSQRTVSPSALQKATFCLKMGEAYSIDNIL